MTSNVLSDTERLIKHYVNEDAVVRGYVYAATRNHQDTEDILQEIWKTLVKKLDQYDEDRPFRAWALGVARFQVLKWRQSLARSREFPSDTVVELLADTATRHADTLDLRVHFLETCLSRLALHARRVLELKYMEGLKSRDIGARLGRHAAAVDMTLSRARRLVRDCIEKHLQAERKVAVSNTAGGAS